MDIPHGSPGHHAFATGVGLVTSTGPHGENIMAAEWTHQLSYEPGMVGVALGPNKATTENIRATKEFGLSIAAENQNVLSSLAGGSSGRTVRKIDGLKELGFTFLPSEHIKAPLVDGAALQVECKLVDERVYGDHVLFVGEALRVIEHPGVLPVIYNRGKYWKFGESIPKPPPEQLDPMKAVMQKHVKA